MIKPRRDLPTTPRWPKATKPRDLRPYRPHPEILLANQRQQFRRFGFAHSDHPPMTRDRLRGKLFAMRRLRELTHWVATGRSKTVGVQLSMAAMRWAAAVPEATQAGTPTPWR